MHGSQDQHSCLTHTVFTNADQYWNQALGTVSHQSIIFEFLTRCEVESLPIANYSTVEAINNASCDWEDDIKDLVCLIARRNFL